MPPTDSDRTRSKGYSDICDKSNCNLSDKLGDEKLRINNSKSLTNDCDINRVGDEISWIEEILLINLDYTKNKSHGDLCNKSNYDISDRISGEEFGSNDSKDLIDNCDIGKVGNEMS